VDTVCFDGVERHPIDARGAIVLFRQLVGSVVSRLQTWPYKPQNRHEGSAFALTYSLRRRSCSVMGALVISPLPPLVEDVRCSKASLLHGRSPLPRCRVGGGAPPRWPPSAAQTARTGFPYTAFTKIQTCWDAREGINRTRFTSPYSP